MGFCHPVAAGTSGASENQPEPLTVPQGWRSLFKEEHLLVLKLKFHVFPSEERRKSKFCRGLGPSELAGTLSECKTLTVEIKRRDL